MLKVLLPIPRNIHSSGCLMTQSNGNSSIFTSGDFSVSLVSWKHFILLNCPSWHSKRSVPLESYPSPFSTLLCGRKVDAHGLHHLVSSVLWPLFVWPMERPAQGKKVGWETSLTSWIPSPRQQMEGAGRGCFPLSCIIAPTGWFLPITTGSPTFWWQLPLSVTSCTSLVTFHRY